MNIDENTLLKQFQNRVVSNSVLRSCVFHASVEGNTLVVFCKCSRKLSKVRALLKTHWSGEIEVYRPRDLLVGARSKDEDVFTSSVSRLLH